MDTNAVTIKSSQFSKLVAKSNQEILDEFIGCTVTHNKYGKGIITKIVKRDNYIPLIYILFDSDKEESKFNSDSFRDDIIMPMNIPQKIIDIMLQRKKEREIQFEIAKQEENKRKLEAIENH